ncbi:37S ribosomal protein S24, mitochondrial, variant 2 [Basidiobolus ranarum]|uniref:37S ribosomal protein S24, mitochondrial, variant 2 n=1 Tax=Basidiobolus ranarum TaxID=34480 RepID=A0ABR2VW89_9FUNG
MNTALRTNLAQSLKVGTKSVTKRHISATATVLARAKPTANKLPERDVGDLPDYDFNDHTWFGHNMLENIRDVRSYLKKAQYELPQLVKFQKPFVPPKSVGKIVAYKTTEYFGEEHPNARKVVLTVNVDNLGLTATQKHKILLLSGPRYNPEKNEIKISCEKYRLREQNYKDASDVLDKLLEYAKVFTEFTNDLKKTISND